MKGTNNNDKSDNNAKTAFLKELENQGFKAKVISRPADIKAIKDNQTWYFEIKKTKHTDRYFGAATMTEWSQALKHPDHFRFVIAIERKDGTWDFKGFTPDEFQKFSTIPPFKVYFNIYFNKIKSPEGKTTDKDKVKTPKTVRMNKDNFKKMEDTYLELRENRIEKKMLNPDRKTLIT